MKLQPATFHINSNTTVDTRMYLRFVALYTLINLHSASIYEYEETSTNQISTIVRRTDKALIFPLENTKNTNMFHILTSRNAPSNDPSVTIYQYQPETGINNSSVHVSNRSFAHHNETTDSPNKKQSTLITAVVASIIVILCIGGSVYLYKRKYNPTWHSKTDTNLTMSTQKSPQQKNEDYETVYDVDVSQHGNPSFIIELNKDNDYDKLGPDRDGNAYDKLQESTSQKYENSGKERKLNSNMANQLQESLKYENSETNQTKDFKSQNNFGDSIASKLYESIDNYNSIPLTESTTYAEIE